MTAEPILLTVVAPTPGGSRCVDLAVAADVDLADVLGELLQACGLDPGGRWAVLDGGRALRMPGPGLAAQGVVSGSVLRLERQEPLP